jgi:copper(I)-binding protein
MTTLPRFFSVSLLLAAVAPPVSAELTLSDAWLRAMPPTQSMTAGYLTLRNDDTQDRVVTGASSDASPRVEIHTTVERDGMQRMEAVSRIPLASGDALTLTPGGYHLMLREMPRMPAVGESVTLCIEFAEGEPVCTQAEVRRDAPDTDHSHNH